MSRLRSIEEVPQPFTQIFQNYPSFNPIQSAVFDDILYSTSPVVITAPTGSGKTVLFELAVVSLLLQSTNNQSFKAIYIAPVKALCNERYIDWCSRFHPLGIACIEVTGDNMDDPSLDDYQIILTTPEKWDSLTRRWRDKISLFLCVKLLMIDEVHLIRDEKRGPILESIVCRMKTMMRVLNKEGSVRFIAVSATIFNIEDLAIWLGSREEPALFYRFGNESRPVALKRIVKGFPQAKGQSEFVYDIQLSYKLKPILLEHAQGKPVLIFCSTRRGVVQTSKTLSEQLSFRFTAEDRNNLLQACSQMVDSNLRNSVLAGIAYHHAGMVKCDRTTIQDLFMQGSLPVLVATSTLAMGVNLPAHLVIIKSTHQYIAGRIEEYPDSTVLQMIGRAGRPQFDTSATAVILTRPARVLHYENLLDSKEILESSLHLHLAEHLNSEIVLLTIRDLGVAMEWLRCTFLYQRAMKNPQFYGLGSIEGNMGRIEKALEAIVIREINALKRDGLVEMNENGLDISPTANGRLMSYYYVNFITFRLFANVTSTTTMKELLLLLSDCNELSEMQLRVSERRVLNELNICKQKETVRFPVKGKINSRSLKVNCLIQACLGCLTISDPSLFQEALRAVNILERVVKCLVQYLKLKNWYIAYLSAVILAKCLHARLWENSIFISRQLEKIGPALSSILVQYGKTNFELLEKSLPQELERILNRSSPLGTMLIDQVRHLPRYLIQAELIDGHLSKMLKVSLSIGNKLLVIENNTAGNYHCVTIVVGDSDNNLLHSRQVPDSTLLRGVLTFTVPLPPRHPQKVIVNVVSNQWVGIDVSHSVTINPLVGCIVSDDCFITEKPGKSEKKEKPRKEKNDELVSGQVSDPISWKRMSNPSHRNNLEPETPKVVVEYISSSEPEKYPWQFSPDCCRHSVKVDLKCSFDVEPMFFEDVNDFVSPRDCNRVTVHEAVQIDANNSKVKELETFPPLNSSQNLSQVRSCTVDNLKVPQEPNAVEIGLTAALPSLRQSHNSDFQINSEHLQGRNCLTEELTKEAPCLIEDGGQRVTAEQNCPTMNANFKNCCNTTFQTDQGTVSHTMEADPRSNLQDSFVGKSSGLEIFEPVIRTTEGDLLVNDCKDNEYLSASTKRQKGERISEISEFSSSSSYHRYMSDGLPPDILVAANYDFSHKLELEGALHSQSDVPIVIKDIGEINPLGFLVPKNKRTLLNNVDDKNSLEESNIPNDWTSMQKIFTPPKENYYGIPSFMSGSPETLKRKAVTSFHCENMVDLDGKEPRGTALSEFNPTVFTGKELSSIRNGQNSLEQGAKSGLSYSNIQTYRNSFSDNLPILDLTSMPRTPPQGKDCGISYDVSESPNALGNKCLESFDCRSDRDMMVPFMSIPLEANSLVFSEEELNSVRYSGNSLELREYSDSCYSNTATIRSNTLEDLAPPDSTSMFRGVLPASQETYGNFLEMNKKPLPSLNEMILKKNIGESAPLKFFDLNMNSENCMTPEKAICNLNSIAQNSPKHSSLQKIIKSGPYDLNKTTEPSNFTLVHQTSMRKNSDYSPLRKCRIPVDFESEDGTRGQTRKALVPYNSNALSSKQFPCKGGYRDNIFSSHDSPIFNHLNIGRTTDYFEGTCEVIGDELNPNLSPLADPSCDNSSSFYFERQLSHPYLCSDTSEFREDGSINGTEMSENMENVEPCDRSMKEVLEMARVAKMKAKGQGNWKLV